MDSVEYFQPRRRLFWAIVGALAAACFFAAFTRVIPFQKNPILFLLEAGVSVFSLWTAVMGIWSFVVNKPTLVLTPAGINLRVSPHSFVELPWKGVLSSAIQVETSRLPGGFAIRRRRLVVKPRNLAELESQLSPGKRLLFNAGLKLTQGSLVIYEMNIDHSLEDVVAAMRVYAKS